MTGVRCAAVAGCEAVATCRVARATRPTGGTAYMTIVPISLASATGVASCADHVHNMVDGMLMGALGEASPPARETMTGGDQ